MYQTLVIIHAALGGIALLAGSFAAFYRKGGKNHILAGRIFAVAMFSSAAMAVVLTLIEPNPFLLGIALFTAYMVASGFNWIMRTDFEKKLHRARIVGAIGIGFVVFMGYTAYSEQNLSIVLLVFAVILSIMSAADLFQSPSHRQTAARHGGRMGGAFVAAVTAFLVVNVDFLPPLLVWLAPTVAGGPLIALGIRNFYKRNRA